MKRKGYKKKMLLWKSVALIYTRRVGLLLTGKDNHCLCEKSSGIR